jgi:multiple sugar transport system permease protein
VERAIAKNAGTTDADARRKGGRPIKRVLRSISFLILFLWVLFTVVQLYWMAMSSFRPGGVEVSFKPEWMVRHPTLDPYRRFLGQPHALRWFVNSVIIAGTITGSNLLFSAMAGYAFAKLRFPARNTIFWMLLATIMIPGQVTLIPLYILVINVLGLGNTYVAVIAPFLTTVYNIFLIKQYMSSLPSALMDAARIDGCSELGVFFRIIAPISLPGLAVMAIFTFVTFWNLFFWPFLVTTSDDMRTVQVGLALFRYQQATDYGAMMAGATLAALPMFVLFFALQKYFLQGITIGAVKG